MSTPKPTATKKAPKDMVKTSLRIPRDLWKKVQHLAVDEEREVQSIVADALTLYLKGGKA